MAVATDGVPGWLALELRPAWQRHGDRLVDALDELGADRQALGMVATDPSLRAHHRSGRR